MQKMYFRALKKGNLNLSPTTRVRYEAHIYSRDVNEQVRYLQTKLEKLRAGVRV